MATGSPSAAVFLILPIATANAARIEAALAASIAGNDATLSITTYGPGAPHPTYGAAANGIAHASMADQFIFVHAAQPTAAGWLPPLQGALAQPGAAVAGPRVITNDGTGDICGFMVTSAAYTYGAFVMQKISNLPTLLAFDAIPADCIATTRAMFEQTNGFATDLGAEYAAYEYCFRAAESGGRVFIEPRVAFARGTVPDSATEPLFLERWRERVETHDNFWPELLGSYGRADFYDTAIALERAPLPKITAIVHGNVPASAQFIERLWKSRLAPSDVLWAAPGDVPPRARRSDDAIATARALTEVRGRELIAFVRTDTELAPDWLNDLINAVARLPETVASTIDSAADPLAVAATADARCTLVAPRTIPQHLRIEPAADLDRAVATWLGNVAAAGRTIARVSRTATRSGPIAPGISRAPASVTVPPPADVLASIVMLSWNAPEFTEIAVASIREHTRVPYEIIVIDNGSGPETLERLARIPDIRVIYNAVNTGFGFGCNQGIAAARGTHIVLLNNDVVVTDGWLEALLAVLRKNPTLGCSAPRTNSIAGPQQIDNVPYTDLADLPAFAAQRAREQRGGFTHQARVIGFCMCIPRHVLDEVGAFDPRYGSGNFEDDDLCMRIRGAGYDIAVCEDAFIHHFGSVTFTTNKVDHRATIQRNLAIFSKRWNVPFTTATYDAREAFSRGFVRATDYVALPEPVGVGADWKRPL